jgi:hypothetical protein
MTTDAIAYTATVSGGDGQYSYAWNPASCSGTTCVVNPSDSAFCYSQNLNVTVDDGNALCAARASETETYAKVTVVNATDN